MNRVLLLRASSAPVLAVVSLLAIGCSPAPMADAGSDASLQSDSAMDGTGATDTFQRPDRVVVGEDTPSEPVDVVINPGRCGIAVHDCICNCRNDTMCQANCTQLNADCGDCVLDGQIACCPAEWMPFSDCLLNSTCPEGDEACLMRECGALQTTFRNCVTRQANVPSCQMQFRACFGPEYPNIRCVMMQ